MEQAERSSMEVITTVGKIKIILQNHGWRAFAYSLYTPGKGTNAGIAPTTLVVQ